MITKFCSRSFSLLSRYVTGIRPMSTMQRSIPNDGKTLDDFVSSEPISMNQSVKISDNIKSILQGHSFVIETYGCQMNKADSNIMETLLKDSGMELSEKEEQADVIIMNTCSVREHAESRIWNRLEQFRHLDKKYKKHTILCISGCMASRLEQKLLAAGVDVIVGPDSYTHLPSLLSDAFNGHQVSHTVLSTTDTYNGIETNLTDPQPCTQVTIMRGCNNMCSYCVVPYTRGRERSVDLDTILHEVKRIKKRGYKEIMLLGQNVNSYCDSHHVPTMSYQITSGFTSSTNNKQKGILFPELLDIIATEVPEIRLRFMSPHPKDFPLQTLQVIKNHPNICHSLHIPLQSGSNTCLDRMNRPYTREAYLHLIQTIRETLPDCSISTDIITGFCGETEEEHEATLRLLEEARFDHAFMYLFSMRENTFAWKYYKDDIPLEIKKRRLTEIQDMFYSTLKKKLPSLIGKRELVLVEGESKQSTSMNRQFKGRNDGNRMCVFNKEKVATSWNAYQNGGETTDAFNVGDYVACEIVKAGTGTHIVKPLFKTTLEEYSHI